MDRRGNKFKDITGKKFNKLQVLSFNAINKDGQAAWDCLCDCGNSCIVRGNLIRTGKTKSCGCLVSEWNSAQMEHRIDHIGERFGRLLVTGKSIGHRKLWNVKCDCGKEKIVSYSNLSVGGTASCGCLKKVGNVSIKENPLQLKRRSYSIKKYGITLELFEKLLTAQDNKCALCKKEFFKTPHVDHDHSCCALGSSCGKCIRGLLCSKCNTALGLLDDDVSILRDAIHYLEQPLEVPVEVL